MSTRTKTLAKSLHTVSVLVSFGRYALSNNLAAAPQHALDGALEVLGYTDAADPYDLKGAALRQLEKEQPNA